MVRRHMGLRRALLECVCRLFEWAVFQEPLGPLSWRTGGWLPDSGIVAWAGDRIAGSAWWEL